MCPNWGRPLPRNRCCVQCVRSQTLSARSPRLTQLIDMHAHAIPCINKQDVILFNEWKPQNKTLLAKKWMVITCTEIFQTGRWLMGSQMRSHNFYFCDFSPTNIQNIQVILSHFQYSSDSRPFYHFSQIILHLQLCVRASVRIRCSLQIMRQRSILTNWPAFVWFVMIDYYDHDDDGDYDYYDDDDDGDDDDYDNPFQSAGQSVPRSRLSRERRRFIWRGNTPIPRGLPRQTLPTLILMILTTIIIWWQHLHPSPARPSQHWF